MLEEILNHVHNACTVPGASRSGVFRISSGALEGFDGLLDGQHYWIAGSIFNDGLHQHPAVDLQDETFRGTIAPAAIPKALTALDEEITAWVKDHPVGDKTSESFGGYSYSMATGKDGAPLTWEAAFASKLDPWRKLS